LPVPLDQLLQPVLDAVLARAGIEPGAHVLDIGCGTGASCLAAAERTPGGAVLGADISPTLLSLARERCAAHPAISLIEADAATHGFAPAAFDHLISRFGVMFFADPTAAFANMARALKPGARVSFASWGQIPANPYFTHAAQAARDALGPMPKSDPDAPGPFAFRDPDRVLAILGAAGLHDAQADVLQLHLTPTGTLDDYVTQACAIGPAEATIREYQPDDAGLAALRAALHRAFAPFDTPDGLRIPAEIVIYTASA
jgi:SAM-dependent methyltransferase